MAQAVINDPGRCRAEFPNANCQNLGPGNPYTDSGYRYRGRHVAYRHNRDYDNEWNRTHTGFWPADVVGGAVGTAGAVAGAAVGTAGAIATAPFRSWDNSYAGPYGWDHRTYAQRNGFVCTPGTFFKGEDGRRHICQ